MRPDLTFRQKGYRYFFMPRQVYLGRILPRVGLEVVQIGDCSLRMGGSRENRPLVIFQEFSQDAM